jgi:hypothetical protein
LFYRITIDRGEAKFSQSGLEELRVSGMIFIPKMGGLPKRIIVTIREKEKEV